MLPVDNRRRYCATIKLATLYPALANQMEIYADLKMRRCDMNLEQLSLNNLLLVSHLSRGF